MRADVVAHINNNYEQFEHELKGCVLDRKKMSDIQDIDAESKLYLNHCLPKPGCWGGVETIKAVSRMYEVNVIIVNEDGAAYLVNGFSLEYQRTLILAYRLGDDDSKICRNHYDSVTNMDQTDIFNCVKLMSASIMKFFFKDEEGNTITID